MYVDQISEKSFTSHVNLNILAKQNRKHQYDTYVQTFIKLGIILKSCKPYETWLKKCHNDSFIMVFSYPHNLYKAMVAKRTYLSRFYWLHIFQRTNRRLPTSKVTNIGQDCSSLNKLFLTNRKLDNCIRPRFLTHKFLPIDSAPTKIKCKKQLVWILIFMG